MESGADLAVAIAGATRTEPTVPQLWSTHRGGGEKTLRGVLAGLEASLAAGITLDSAVGAVAPGRYERWLAETLFQQLLRDQDVLPAAAVTG